MKTIRSIKALVFAAICFVTITDLNAQIGFRAGLNFASADWEVLGTNLTNSASAGLQLGVVADFQINGSLYFNTGALYSMKGAKTDFSGIEVVLNLDYIEIPVNLAYKFDLEGAKPFIQAGPYLGFAINGNAKSGGATQEIKFGSADDELKGVDVGINIGAGVEISSVQLAIVYGLGLTDIENVDSASWKNRVVTISIAYFLKRE